MTVDLKALPGLKERHLVALGPCAVCKRPLLEGGPTFYVVETKRGIFDTRAVQRRAGLTMMLGSDPLARVFSPDEDLAKVFDGPARVVVHEDCAGKVSHLLELFPVTEPEEEQP
jgi:hypothetical protein